MERGDQKGLAGYAAMYRTAGRPVAESRYQGGFHSTGLQHLLGMRSTARPCVRSLISCR